MADEDCLVCRQIAGDINVPGGSLVDDEAVFAFHMPPLDADLTPYLGHLLVSPKRHVDHFGDLEEAEAARIGGVAAQLSKALRESEPVERVFAAVIGTHVPHFHLHLLPRYVGTPPEIRWYQVDEWEDAQGADRWRLRRSSSAWAHASEPSRHPTARARRRDGGLPCLCPLHFADLRLSH